MSHRRGQLRQSMKLVKNPDGNEDPQTGKTKFIEPIQSCLRSPKSRDEQGGMGLTYAVYISMYVVSLLGKLYSFVQWLLLIAFW